MSVRWGLLSTARINRRILAGAAASDRVRIDAVASRSPEVARAYAQEHGIPRAHGDYASLLADPDVDAVYIPLPNGMHVDWTMRALEAGKHVLIEKPFSRRAAEVEAAFDLADRQGLVLSEAFMWRHNPQAAEMRRLVEAGAVGRVRVVRASFSFPLAEVHGPEDARFDPALDGGSLMDVGCYCVSAMRLVAGEPVRVSGEQVLGPSGVDVVFTGTLRFADDVVGHFDCGFVLPYRDEVEIVGEEASLFVDQPWLIHEPCVEIRRPGGDVERVEVAWADSYRLQLEDVSDAITTGTPPLLGRADAVGQARAIEALYRSAETGRAVERQGA